MAKNRPTFPLVPMQIASPSNSISTVPSCP
jgi:hypothetical protein